MNLQYPIAYENVFVAIISKSNKCTTPIFGINPDSWLFPKN